MKMNKVFLGVTLMVAVTNMPVTTANEGRVTQSVADASESIYEHGQQRFTRIERVPLPDAQLESRGDADLDSSTTSEIKADMSQPAESVWTPTPLTEAEPTTESVEMPHSIPSYPVEASVAEEEAIAAEVPVQLPTGLTVEERLEVLTQIRVRGEMTGDEYLAARKKILFGP